MRLFKCKHNWNIDKRSNILQLDDMGFPLRLFICKCSKCGKSEQMWLDVSVKEAEEIKTGASFWIAWSDYEAQIYEKQYEVADTAKTNKAAKSALRYESMIGDFSKDGRDLKLQTEKEFCEAMTELADDLIRNETSI